MRIAFYAPLKAPTHPAPSGDRRMAQHLWRALADAGDKVALAATFRSYDAEGNRRRQAALKASGTRLAKHLVRRYRAQPKAARPELWFTYHVYHKAPDWLGPAVSGALGIPYVIAEASFARKQTGGAWALGQQGAAHAIARADTLLSFTPEDEAGIAPLAKTRGCLRRLAPFLDPAPYQAARAARAAHRGALARALDLAPERPWLLAVGMMRPGDKLASYRVLGRCLSLIAEPPWQLVVVGDGPARHAVEESLAPIGRARLRFAGVRDADELAAFYAAADLMVWPAYNEAYGMALLEAAATGLPAVAGRWRGVPEIVADGETGLLSEPRDDIGFAEAVVVLSGDTERRQAMGRAASARVAARHSLAAAIKVLRPALDEARRIRTIEP